MFNLLFDCQQYPERFQHMKPGDKYGTWSLVWNGQHTQSLPIIMIDVASDSWLPLSLFLSPQIGSKSSEKGNCIILWMDKKEIRLRSINNYLIVPPKSFEHAQ